MEAIIGETIEDEAVEFVVVVVIMRLLEVELLKFVELVFGILVAVVGMTRVGFVEAVAVVVVVTVEVRGLNAIIFFPPGPVITIS